MNKKLAKRINYSKYGYLFSLPFVVAFLIFTLYPLLYTSVLGFTDLSGAGTEGFNFIWKTKGADGEYLSVFHNFKQLFYVPAFVTDGSRSLFETSLKNTFLIWIMNFIPQIVLSLALAAWFTNKMLKVKAVGFFKIMFYMPNIITAASIALLFRAFFDHPISPANDLLFRMGLIDEPINFLNSFSPAYARIIVAFIQFWMWYGVTMIILVAGIMGISPTLFESAAIDGANHIKAFFYITLPSLRTILLYVLVTSFVGGMQMFDIPFLFNQGRPNNMTLTTSLYIFNMISPARNYSRAAAASVVMFLIICVGSALFFYIMRDKDKIKERREYKARERARRGF